MECVQRQKRPWGSLLHTIIALVAPCSLNPRVLADVTCAIIQFSDVHPDEVTLDADRLEGFVRTAAQNGAQLIVAPENCLYRYSPWERNGVTELDLANGFDSLVARFSKLADTLNVCLIFGLREPSGDPGKPTYQSAVFLDYHGNLLKTYRKRLPSNSEFSYTLSGGNDWESFTTPYGRVWMQICKDMDSDGYVDSMPTDIELLIGINKDRDHGWGKVDAGCARAQCYGIGANWAGDADQEGGNSGFVGPDGAMLLEAGEGNQGANEVILYQDLPLPEAGGPMDGQIVVDPDHPQWLRIHNAGPFFMCGPGDPEGFLYRGTRNADGTRSGDQMALINKLAGTGADCIYFQAVRSHGGDGDSTHNPFVDSDPSRGMSEPILDQWEAWFTAMEEQDIVMYFFFYDDSARIWNTGNTVGADERAFLRAMVNRFEHHKLLVWCIAEEYSERYTPQRVSAIAAEIRLTDDHNHVIAVHQLSGLTFDFADDPAIDQFAIQYNQSTPEALHSGMLTAWRTAAGRYSLNMAEAANHGTGAVMRRKNWACAMGGASVMVLGMDIATTPVTDLQSCGYLVTFFEQTTFNDMAPHDELAAGATDYVLAYPGESYILYAGGPGDLGVTNLTAGTYSALWFDPVDGSQELATTVNVGPGTQSFTRPDSLGTEAALYLIRTGTVPFRRGEANADGDQNLADAIFILSYLFADGPIPTCLDAADANDDGATDMADGVYILQYLFASSPPLSPPFPDCGVDATADDLDCRSYNPCR